MALGTAIGAVVGGVGSLISSGNNKKAINKATDAQSASNAQAIAAQERARSDNLALQRPIYNAGMPAINARNALLGLGGGQSTPTAQPTAMQYSGAGTTGYGGALGSFYQNKFGGTGALSFGTPTAQPMQAAQVGGETPQQAATDAFDMFRDSTGYQFRLNEGYDAINSGYAGAGTLQSGAAMKAITDYGQDYASNEFGKYFGMLGEQQNLAAGSANAMSGVNTTYANNAGSLAIQNGQNIANGAVARANNSNALIGSFAQGIGGVLGAIG